MNLSAEVWYFWEIGLGNEKLYLRNACCEQAEIQYMHCMMVSVLDTFLPRSLRTQLSSLAVIVWATKKNVLVLRSEHTIKVIYHQQWQKFQLYHQKRLHLIISNIIDGIDYFLAGWTTTSQNLSTIYEVLFGVTQHERASNLKISVYDRVDQR